MLYGYIGRPDVIGVTRDRFTIEIEVKQTISDFKANEKKRVIQWRKSGLVDSIPRQFYFLVPANIYEKVIEYLPQGSGLLWLPEGTNRTIVCAVGATIAKESRRVTNQELIRAVMHQSATLHRAVKALAAKLIEGNT